MEKTKYRYKCMICGTEVISADDVLSCSACGSDELAKLEIMPVIDVVEKKPPRKQPRRRKSAQSLASDPDVLSIIKDLDSETPTPTHKRPSVYIPREPAPPPPKPASVSPYTYKRPSVHIPPPAPPPPTKLERINSFIVKKIPWRILSRIIAPLAIGGVVYGIVKLFI